MSQLSKARTIQALERDIDSIILGFDAFLAVPVEDKDLIDIQVISYNQGYGLLTVMLPEAMIRFFVAQLEMYHGLWRATQFKLKCAKAEKKAVDPVEIEKRDKRKADYEKELFTVFDGLIKKGVPVREAIKKTRSMLKDKGYSWNDYFSVFSTLSSSGRLKGTGFYGKTK